MAQYPVRGTSPWYQPLRDYIDAQDAAVQAASASSAQGAKADSAAQVAGDLGGTPAAPTVTGGTHHTHTGIPRSVPESGLVVDGLVLDEADVDGADQVVSGRSGGRTVISVLHPAGSGADMSGSDINHATSSVVMADGTPGTYGEAGARLTEHTLGNDGLVPDWVLTRWVGRMGLAVQRAPIDLWLILGQSNATQRSTVPAVVATDTPRVVQWSGAAWQTAAGNPPWLGSGVARGWLDYDAQASGRRAGIVPCAVGSTGFTLGSANGHWLHGQTGTGPDLATAAVTQAAAALAAAPSGSRIMGVVWSQGENDQTMDPSTYMASLDDLIGWVRATLSLPRLPWVVCPLTPQATDPIEAVQETTMMGLLEDTARRVENVSWLQFSPDDSEGVAGDTLHGIHWTPEAQHRRGRAICGGYGAGLPSAWECAVLNRADAAPHTPQGLSCSRSGDQAVWTWYHPTTRVTSFTLETSVDSGGTWQTQTLTGPGTHTCTMTCPAGTPVWARITAVCPTGSSYTSREVHA